MTDPDYFVKAALFTKKYFRDVYPAVDPRSPQLTQAGKVAIVTGAGRGIGKGIALAFARAGAQGIVLASRSQKNVDAVRDAVKKENGAVEVLAIAADISNEQDVERLFAAAQAKFPVIHTLVNNAGVLTSGFDAIGKVAPSTWWADFEVNMKGTFLVTSGFLKAFGAQQKTIINLGSDSTLLPTGLSSYFSTKIGIVKLTEFIAAENPEMVAYSINPGVVPTDAVLDDFLPFAKDTAYLNGRQIYANWDVQELEARAKEIVDSDKLKMKLRT
ncbi:hypothetical protein SLS56_011259 [Neofusicoccum ribis]|uniref:Uncharacterized protein n=1 Tax=Neofusicoccum ribis TaxID=45134 RepID=A0ABR3SDL8_9PEZI